MFSKFRHLRIKTKFVGIKPSQNKELSVRHLASFFDHSTKMKWRIFDVYQIDSDKMIYTINL